MVDVVNNNWGGHPAEFKFMIGSQPEIMKLRNYAVLDIPMCCMCIPRQCAVCTTSRAVCTSQGYVLNVHPYALYVHLEECAECTFSRGEVNFEMMES